MPRRTAELQLISFKALALSLPNEASPRANMTCCTYP